MAGFFNIFKKDDLWLVVADVTWLSGCDRWVEEKFQGKFQGKNYHYYLQLKRQSFAVCLCVPCIAAGRQGATDQ